MNHIMFGEIAAWLYKGLGGIKPDPAQPGFKHVVLTPNFVAGLHHFEASHDGPYGTIRSAWKQNGATVVYSVTVPPNTTATLTLPVAPGQAVYQAGKLLAAARPTTRPLQSTGQLRQYKLAAGTCQLAIQQGR